MEQSFDERVAAAGFPLTSHGHTFNTAPSHLGELRSSNDIQDDAAALRERMAEDGYLLLRGYLDREQVLGVRRELVEKLDGVGLLRRDRPLLDAVTADGPAGEYDRKALGKSIRTGAALRGLCHQGRIIEFYERFLGGAVRTFEYIWVRAVRPGRATGVHFDWVYMKGGTANLYTSWVPIGDVPLSDGPLAILENSHRIRELQQTYGDLDVYGDNPNRGEYAGGTLTNDMNSVQARYGGRWLTTEFRAGDLLLFGMYTLHCSVDNRSPDNRYRLSLDARYQLASEPIDQRWATDEHIHPALVS